MDADGYWVLHPSSDEFPLTPPGVSFTTTWCKRAVDAQDMACRLTLCQSSVYSHLTKRSAPPHISFTTTQCKRAAFFVLHHHLTRAQPYLAGLPHPPPCLRRMTATREHEDLCKIRPPVIGDTGGGRRAR
ncbi:uncharacterized protein LAESUDRAFT_757967 [Laetiporus sulphureus 93-53]|uniref:Uncharacterized protein n=1 Tax=Laetiporus sulphureus 93-53 TaxID=1314785 RepID=A0A165EV24_9APHY|nr:uncharacterized protein LAESUDRAFT_757967 [Laetiporus sulphureus 93-53]KZT07820.1 hypothetical protein LAESUDRAFT_757967 [Laetiporus sulphureus 93-53]